jgi:hypothetical protein
MCAGVLLCFPPSARAQDADGDSIPDAVERRLGTNPAEAEVLSLLVDDSASGAGDKNIGSEHKLANDVLQCFAGHVGDDRYLIKITLAAPYRSEGTVFHVYVDWDNDQTNGRQDGDWVRGVDIMYSAVNGQFGPRIFTSQTRANSEIPPRWAVEGNTVYVCDDVKPKIIGNKAQFRLYVLSHMTDNTRDSDSTAWITAEVPVDATRKAPPPPVPVRANFEVLPGDWELLGELWHSATAVVLRPPAEAASGYEWWHDASVVSQGKVGERLSINVPKDGMYYVACVVYGRYGVYPGIEVLLNDKELGVIAGPTAGFDELLFFSSVPAQFHKGDRLVFATAENSTPYRVGMFMLLAEKPEMPKLRIEEPQVWHMPHEPGKPEGRVLVSWRTNRPVECSVECAIAGPEAYEEREKLEPQPGQNQRAFYVVLDRSRFRASRYALNIRAKEEDRPPYFEGHKAEASVTIEMHPPRPGRERSGEVELAVAEPTDSPRTWPVRSGVPLPRGCLWDASRCQLLGPDGKLVPAQFGGWSYWPDRSVKWLIVDFVAQTNARQSASYRLRYGIDPVDVKPGISVRDEEDGLTVSGARVRIVLERRQALGKVWADRNGDGKVTEEELVLPGATLVLTGADGKRYTAGPPDTTTVCESGPVRAIVRRSGAFVADDGTKYFRYLLFLHVWRDLPHVYMEISLDNDNVTQEMSLLTSLALELPTSADAAWLRQGEPMELSERPWVVLQDYDNRYLMNGERAGEHHSGGAALFVGGKPILLAAVRDFWKLWPKGFRASRSGLMVDLLPELPANAYQSPEDQELVDRLYFWCENGKYKLRAGTRFTTEVLLDFAPPSDPGGLTAECAHVSNPLFAACAPEHYCASGAFGGVYPRDGKTFPRYDENVDWSFEDHMKRQKDMREYGFHNYGDWYGERKWNWGNIEYDTQWALAVLFAHNGNLEMLWRGQAAAIHNADVDTIHYHTDPRMVGKVYIHCLCHTGSYFPPQWREGGGIRSGSSHCHTWVQGQLVHAALFGNYRLRENAEVIAEESVRSRSPACEFYARDAGWVLISELAAYEATGNPWYLEGARLMVDRMLQRQDPLSGAMGSHFLDPSECQHRPQHYGPKPFMTGVMLRGLRMYDQIEPRQDVKKAIVRCADWMWNEAWVPKDRGFWYSACPTFTGSGGVWTFNLVGDGLAYACLIDEKHRERRRDLLIEACAAHLYQDGRGGFGKSFTQETCSMLHALEWMRRMGISDVQPPAEKEARARVYCRSAIVLQPGEERVVYPFVVNPSKNEVRVQAAAENVPEWLTVRVCEPCVVAPGASVPMSLFLKCSAAIAPGSSASVRVRFQLGHLRDTRELAVLIAKGEALGRDIGLITGKEDHLGPALAAVGLKMVKVPEASWDVLVRFHALAVGSEALFYNYADVRNHFLDLQRFVLCGGTLLLGQINDQGWDSGLLPRDIYLDEPDTAAGAVCQATHPLFSGVNAEALSGIICYDCVLWAAPEWRILMTDCVGRPAVLEAHFGAGKVLVVEPSFDRPVVDQTDRHADRSEVCRAFVRNLARYLAE